MPLLLLLLLCAACPARPQPADDDDDDVAVDDDSAADCAPDGSTRCEGPRFDRCVSGEWVPQEVCNGDTPSCDAILGCIACQPGALTCRGDEVWACASDGSAEEFSVDCAPSQCHDGLCGTACDVAEAQMGYLGCRFLAVSTLNTNLDPAFHEDFAVVIGVPADGEAATVNVRRDSVLVAETTVLAGQSEAITLPMVAELQRPGSTFENAESTTVEGGAYEIHTDQPVAAWQFNPLHYDSDAGLLNSHTNDASLLLPEHVLGQVHRALTMPTFAYAPFVQYRGFITVVGTEDGTTVDVQLGSDTAAGEPSAATAGSTISFTVNRGDVVQVLSGADADDDLSGSLVESTRPVAVFVGHDCTYLPIDQPACDHLEEMAFPVDTWGTAAVALAPAHPDTGLPARARYRVQARGAGVEVSFEPALVPPATLDAGAWLEFDTDADFAVLGTGPFQLAQWQLGQDALGATSGGDPAMTLLPPTSQWRERYDFLTPETFVSHWVALTAEPGAQLELDGAPITDGWGNVGGYGAVTLPLGAGPHVARSVNGERFGITVYGYAPYTSYSFPGGLNLRR